MRQDHHHTGTRCAVCVGCGRCFDQEQAALVGAEAEVASWSGKRCEVCVGCGACAQAWGMVDGLDGISHATDMASMAKRLAGPEGHAPAPPATPLPPGSTAGNTESLCDAVTGATPGVSAACRDLGLDSMEDVLRICGIKPPGQA